MNKLFKVCLVATAFAFAAGCAKDKPAPVPVDNTPVKVEKVVKHHHAKGKLGDTVAKKDVTK